MTPQNLQKDSSLYWLFTNIRERKKGKNIIEKYDEEGEKGKNKK